MGKLKSAKGASDSSPDDAIFNMDKFLGEGVMFNCKLFGSMKVEAPRGDPMCAEAINKLKLQAKQLNKESKVHKQRIFLNISLKGIRIIDQKTKKLEHAHIVHKISYISHDKDDRRSFAYVVSLPDGYNLFAFRTEKNAGNVTASLKELFHVIYLKHKQNREKGITSDKPTENNMNQQADNEIETGVEEKEEDPYAIPSKFQLVEQKEDDGPNHYSIPQTKQQTQMEMQEETGNANLLDWEDVNEELEFMHKDMKRSDTKQLLAELGDLNMEETPPHLAENKAVFAADPFFDASPFSPADQGGLKSSTSDPNLKQKSNPFLLAADNGMGQPMSNLSINKSKSMDVGLFDNNDMFSSHQEPTGTSTLMSDAGDLFSSVQPNQQQSAWSTPQPDWTSANTNNMNHQQMPSLTPMTNDNSLFTTLEPEPVPQLVPEKISEPKKGSNDPFAALDGGITSIKGTLPSAEGDSKAQFPKKNSPKPTSPTNAPLTIASGPTVHPSQLQKQQQSFLPQQQQFPPQQQQFPMQQQQRQTNPFGNSPAPYNAGYSPAAPQIPSRPDIPPRVDLMSQTGNFSARPPMQMAPGAPAQNQYMQTNGSTFPTSGMPNMGGSDPFASLGGAFSMGNTAATSEPLYSTVDKSRKSNASTEQANTDMFAMFESKPPASSNAMGDAFGSSFNTTTTAPSNQDPFGDLGSF